MKIKIRAVGETEFDLDGEYQEPAIREAIEDGCNDVASQIIDYTDNERSNISHDEHATVSEDDGTVVWSGWLHGGDGEDAPDGEPTRERRALEAILREIDALDEPGPIADVIRLEAMRGLGEDIGDALDDEADRLAGMEADAFPDRGAAENDL